MIDIPFVKERFDLIGIRWDDSFASISDPVDSAM